MTTYPISVSCPPKFLEELYQCEYGRYEDALRARTEANFTGDYRDVEANDYQLVFCDFGARHRSRIEMRDAAELAETWYALGSGTIGLHNCKRTNQIMDELRSIAERECPDAVKAWPRNTGY